MSEVTRYDCTSGGAKFCQGCYTMEESQYGDYVRVEDFDALTAENERLQDVYKADSQRINALNHLVKELKAELAALKGGQGAVGVVDSWDGAAHVQVTLRPGSALYAHPAPQEVGEHIPDAAKMVSEREAFEAAYQSAVDNGWTSVKHLARQIWQARAALSASAGKGGE